MVFVLRLVMFWGCFKSSILVELLFLFFSLPPTPFWSCLHVPTSQKLPWTVSGMKPQMSSDALQAGGEVGRQLSVYVFSNTPLWQERR